MPSDPSEDRPVPIPYEDLHIGNQNIHVSHKLYKFKGLVYCNRCGAKGTTKAHKLGAPCMPPTVNGRANLKALRAGKLP